MKKALSLEEYDLVIKIGKSYQPALLPADIKRMELGSCFDASAIQALYNQKYRYVEGIAKSFRDNDWKLHAWLTDGVHAFDPTWKCLLNHTGEEIPFPGEYIGIEMDIMKVAEFMAATEYQGVIANRWRNEELATAALESRM